MLKKFLYGLLHYILNNWINCVPIWNIRCFFYKLVGMKIGNNSRINLHVTVFAPYRISIGYSTIINEYSLLDGRGGLVIGNNNNISMYSVIYTASHKSWSDNFEYYTKTTTIGDYCWIGTRSIVMLGTTIEDFAIISAQSVFKGLAQKGCIYSGVPAVYERTRDLSSKYIDNQIFDTYFS